MAAVSRRRRRRFRRRLAVAAGIALVTVCILMLGVLLDGSRGQDATGAAAEPTRADRDKPAALFVGDSFTEGTGATDGQHGYACLAATRMGWHCTLDAQGGTGFINDGSSNSLNFSPFIDRISDDRRKFYADIVIVDGGRNDRGFPVQAVIEAARAYLHEVRRLWHDVPIVVIAPTYLWSTTSNDPFAAQMSRALRSAVQGIHGYLIDPIADGWVSPGQAEHLVWTDGLHPNAEGHRVLAEALRRSLIAAGLGNLPITDDRPLRVPAAAESNP
jgi:lysophospholipase L1-like esterase